MEVKIGEMYGRWKVIGDYKRVNYHRHYLCECTCEKHTRKYIDVFNLTKGKSLSCGCLTAEKARQRMTKHGHTRCRLYNVWMSMRGRCNNKNHNSYDKYGGRGIKICDEWQEYSGFEKWALETGYDENAEYGECTIDRIDTNGNYEPSNCRWANAKEQSNNRRSTHNLTYNGQTKSLMQWSEELNIPYPRVRNRYAKGWSADRILDKTKQNVMVIEFDGKSMTLHEWAEVTGIKPATLRARIKKGWPIEQALNNVR